MLKKISILGSTGSVGQSTLEIVRRHPDRFAVAGLAAGSRLDLLKKQIQEFSPKIVSVKSEKDAKELREIKSVEILHGTEGACQVATIRDVDTVVSAIVGAAGLLPTLAALKAGKKVALANKESMVIAGQIMSSAAKNTKGIILPVDSEHSALFQCLEGQRREDVSRLILTASGGPFWKRGADEFSNITVKEALAHPNWDMGAKITIDSATMMNKGLEVMEARWLFDMSVEKIGIVVHPQSVVHSLVEFKDGSVLAQMGVPDMKIPIAYALSHPERLETGASQLDLAKVGELQFFEPDFEKFPCLKIAFDVARQGETYPAVLNAANEVAVEAFLKERISFSTIYTFVQQTLEAHRPKKIRGLDDVLEADRWAREYSGYLIASHAGKPVSKLLQVKGR